MSLTTLRRSLLIVNKQLGRKQFSALVACDDVFPGLPALKPEPAKATTVSVSTLQNGVTVVTEDSCTVSSVSLTYPKAGSAAENIDEDGAAFVNKFMCYKSGSGLSTIRINRAIEFAGGFPSATLGRTGCTLGFTVTQGDVAHLIPLLATNCDYEIWDYKEALTQAEKEVEAANSSVQVVLTESVYAAAFGTTSPGGRTLYNTGTGIDTAKAFRQRAYGMNGAVLAATGIKDHSAFCTEVTSLLAESPAGSAAPAAGLTYLGGENRVAAGTSNAYVALAFKAPPSGIVGNVVKELISLAGKESGVTGFSGPGFVGAYKGGAPTGIVDHITKALLTAPSADLVKRAKNVAKGDALLALDCGSKSLAEAMAASVLDESLAFTSPTDLAKKYDAVTEAQVKEALSGMFKSNLSLSAIGDIGAVPYHATIASRFS